MRLFAIDRVGVSVFWLDMGFLPGRCSGAANQNVEGLTTGLAELSELRQVQAVG
jgi:hypothetical protein